MSRMRFALIVALLSSPAAAEPKEPAGDAQFCRAYAASAATAAEDAIRRNPSCQDFSKGVHGVVAMHVDWCSRTPRSEVEGASIHIRRLASRCTDGDLAMPTDYGGYDIMGNARFESKIYGEARQWTVYAAFSGRTFMYCSAVNREERGVRIGVDKAEPASGGQWQLAVPVKSRKDWQGTLEVDGKGSGNGGGNQASGTVKGDWTIVWLTMGDVDVLRQGSEAVVGVGKSDFAFRLDGAAAAIKKIEECLARSGSSARG